MKIAEFLYLFDFCKHKIYARRNQLVRQSMSTLVSLWGQVNTIAHMRRVLLANLSIWKEIDEIKRCKKNSFALKLPRNNNFYFISSELCDCQFSSCIFLRTESVTNKRSRPPKSYPILKRRFHLLIVKNIHITLMRKPARGTQTAEEHVSFIGDQMLVAASNSLNEQMLNL